MQFTAIDFETANERRESPCAVGIAVVHDGELIEARSWLMRPSELRFATRNCQIHGIRPEDVADKPEFPEVWRELEPLIAGREIVAHNASFDIGVLSKTLSLYGIARPDFRGYCTRDIARKLWPNIGSFTLSSVAGHLEIPLVHHDPRSDAMACARVAAHACRECIADSLSILADKIGATSRGADYEFPRKKSYPKDKSAKDYIPETTEFDSNHPLFGITIVFTGPLVSMSRTEAMQSVANAGGLPADNVTRKTNLLVVGGRYFDVFSHQTGKVKRAMELRQAGGILEIIGEDDFLKMLAYQ